MKISARNQLPGTVVSVKKGTVMAEVVVRLDGGGEVVAAITAGSVESLGIREGGRVVAIVKATEVMIGAE
jgi:molybdate transport system regulatory protein